MLLLVFLAVLVCAAGQCFHDCENDSSRMFRTGCRFHCHFDLNRNGRISLNEIRTRFNEIATNGRVSYEPFRVRFRNVTKMCDTEARRCFDDFATSGENTDPRFIEQRDIQQIWDDLRLVADRPNAQELELNDFILTWGLLYITSVEDVRCPDGKR